VPLLPLQHAVAVRLGRDVIVDLGQRGCDLDFSFPVFQPHLSEHLLALLVLPVVEVVNGVLMQHKKCNYRGDEYSGRINIEEESPVIEQAIEEGDGDLCTSRSAFFQFYTSSQINETIS
jgi:hypothetical protein